MIIKGIVEEDFVNYKKPSMVIMFPTCTFKCERDCGKRVCQNGTLANLSSFDIARRKIRERYISNTITQAIVFGGLEPLDSFRDVLWLAWDLRNSGVMDDIVIYTGYTEDEVSDMPPFEELKKIPNIVMKYGRYMPDQKPHFDDVLGIKLASDNQYGKRIS